jgi:adenylosuccinate synthase
MPWGRRIIVVVSGPVAGGKSALAKELARRFSGRRLSTRDVLMTHLAEGEQPSRAALQRIGAQLDTDTGGTWVADSLGRKIFLARERGIELVIVDSARIEGQIDGLRNAFAREVCHVLSRPGELWTGSAG